MLCATVFEAVCKHEFQQLTHLVAVQCTDAHLSHHFGHAVGNSNDVVRVDLGIVERWLQLVLPPQRTHRLIDQVWTDGVRTETKQRTEVMHLSEQTTS